MVTITSGVLPKDQNFIAAIGGTSSATDTASSIRPFQYDSVTRGITVHLIGSDILSDTPVIYNTTLTLADTEYSQLLPDNTKELRFRCRTLFDVRFAFVTGKVATPTAPYLTLPAGSEYFSDSNDLDSKTIYFASSEAGVVVELETWS